MVRALMCFAIAHAAIKAPALNVFYEHPEGRTGAMTAGYLDEVHSMQERITDFTRRLKDRTEALDEIVANAAALHGARDRTAKFADASNQASAFLEEALQKRGTQGSVASSTDIEKISASVISNMTKAIASIRHVLLQKNRAHAPCQSPADCASLSSTVNECTERRDALQQAFEDVNVGVHSMGSAIATLCGCMFVGSSDMCAFKDIPPLCVVPYQSYVGVFMSSVAVWDAVKAATAACSVLGAPALASTAPVGGSFLAASQGSGSDASPVVNMNIVYDEDEASS